MEDQTKTVVETPPVAPSRAVELGHAAAIAAQNAREVAARPGSIYDSPLVKTLTEDLPAAGRAADLAAQHQEALATEVEATH